MRCDGQRIKALRLMNGLTLKDLAACLGVQEATVQRYESGKIKDIPDDKVHTISRVLGTSVEYLMGIGDNQDEVTSDCGIEWLLAPTSLAGENIKKRRKALNLSVDELAEKVQVSRQTIYRYETGRLGKISPKTKRRLAKVLQTSVAYIIGKTDDPFDISPPIQTLDALTDAQIIQNENDHIEQEAVMSASKRLMNTVMSICIQQGSRPEKIPEKIDIITQFIRNNEEFLRKSITYESESEDAEN